MVTKPGVASRQKRLSQEMAAQLAELLNQRDLGLITQHEFDEGLERVGSAHPRAARLTEGSLPQGGTRFVLRDAVTGELLERFEFRRVYRPEV
jgi:hypothetical protein